MRGLTVAQEQGSGAQGLRGSGAQGLTRGQQLLAARDLAIHWVSRPGGSGEGLGLLGGRAGDQERDQVYQYRLLLPPTSLLPELLLALEPPAGLGLAEEQLVLGLLGGGEGGEVAEGGEAGE